MKPLWRSRGYIPHFDSAFAIQFITYRLADALPQEILESIQTSSLQENDILLRKRIESYLDAGHGSCLLKDRRAAGIVVDSWRHFDGARYDLHAWVVMPNHVHLLVKPRESHGLAEIVKGWKAFTARAINALYGTKGRVWQVEYWDRYIRDAGHYDSVVAYIHENPVKAGLVATAGDWEWSSAAGGDTCAPGG